MRATRSLDQRVALVEMTRAILTGLPGHEQLDIGVLSGEIADYRYRIDVMPFPEASGLVATDARGLATRNFAVPPQAIFCRNRQDNYSGRTVVGSGVFENVQGIRFFVRVQSSCTTRLGNGVFHVHVLF